MAGCRLSVVAALVLGVLPYVAVGLQFYLQEGETRCFGDTIAPNTKVLGEYTVAAGQGHMPVDIVVRDIANNNSTLFTRTNIDHGKFAFITPFGKQAPKLHTAELHRQEHHGHDHEHVPEHDHGHEHDHEHDHDHDHDHGHEYDHERDHVAYRRTRSLLSSESEHYGHDRDYERHGSGDSVNSHDAPHAGQPHQPYDNKYDHTKDLHREQGEHGHDHDHDHDYAKHDFNHKDGDHHNNDRHYEHYGEQNHDYAKHDFNHNDGDHHNNDHHYEHDRERNHDDHDYLKHVEHDKTHNDDLEKLDHMDAHDGRHEDMKDEWDMDKYDGVDDEEMEKDWLENEKEREHEKGKVPVLDESADLFNTRTFEICVTSTSNSNALKRRVRLVLRHGKTAHDYTRLAKREHMSSLEVTLQVVSDELKELHSELDHARQMEDVLRLVNEATNQRVATYASLSLLVMVAVAAGQALYTKKFFKHKKLL